MKCFMDSVMDALRNARDACGSVARLAERAGVNQVTLGRWLTGERKPTVAEIGKVFDATGVTLAHPGIDPTSFEMVPKVEARAGAGSSLLTDDTVRGYYAFRQDFLQRCAIHAGQSVMLEVLGDSMQPLICHGDTILVDKTDTTPRDGKIFLVGLGEELLVKRLQKAARGWLLVSLNPDYAPTPVEDAEGDNFRVFGRVRWFGRILP